MKAEKLTYFQIINLSCLDLEHHREKRTNVTWQLVVTASGDRNRIAFI